MSGNPLFCRGPQAHIFKAHTHAHCRVFPQSVSFPGERLAGILAIFIVDFQGGFWAKYGHLVAPFSTKKRQVLRGWGQKLTKTDDFVCGRFLYGRIMRQLLVDFYPYLPIGHSIDVSLLPTKGIVAKKLIRLGEGPRFPCKHLPLLTKLFYGTFTVLFSSLLENNNFCFPLREVGFFRGSAVCVGDWGSYVVHF